jgi:acyl-coenzyme A thioesterase 9
MLSSLYQDKAAMAMSRTRQQSSVTTKDSDVNTTGSTFGGHLLRLGYEHGLQIACAHSNQTAQLVTMSEVAFVSLVPIDARLLLVGHDHCVQ